jgi:methylation protein EvaC
MPLAGGFLRKDEFKSEKKIPLEVYLCEDCKLAQICHIVDPVVLFKNYFYISSVIKSLSEHFYEYSEFLKNRYLSK